MKGQITNRLLTAFLPRNEAEKRAYQNGRADAEIKMAEEIRQAHDAKLTAFFWGVFTGSMTVLVLVSVVRP